MKHATLFDELEDKASEGKNLLKQVPIKIVNTKSELISEQEISVAKKVVFNKLDKIVGCPSPEYFMERPNSYVGLVFQDDGVYRVEKDSLGIFAKKITSLDLPQIKTAYKLTPGFKLLVPKAPLKYLAQIYALYTDVMKASRTEAYARIMYNLNTNEFKVEVPMQSVTAGNVFREDMTPEEVAQFAERNIDIEVSKLYQEGWVMFLDSHSHHSMNAFWSGTDNSNDKTTGFKAVLGRLDSSTPDLKMRVIVNATEVKELKLSDLFETEEDNFRDALDLLPDEDFVYDRNVLKNIYKGSMPSLKKSTHTGFFGNWSPSEKIEELKNTKLYKNIYAQHNQNSRKMQLVETKEKKDKAEKTFSKRTLTTSSGTKE